MLHLQWMAGLALAAEDLQPSPFVRCIVVTERDNGTDICFALLQCAVNKGTVAFGYIRGTLDNRLAHRQAT